MALIFAGLGTTETDANPWVMAVGVAGQAIVLIPERETKKTGLASTLI
ncbi:hypothetical protein [Zwartia sp.]